MSADPHFAFAVYDPSGDATFRCDAWLAAYNAGEATWTPDGQDCAISLRVDGRERLLDEWNFGPLALIARQAALARERLVAGQVALIRSGVLDESSVPFLLLEPRGDQAQASVVFLPEPQSDWFPLSDFGPGTPEALYDWLADHRDEVLAASREDSDLLEVGVPLSQLLADLDAQVAIARRVVAIVSSSAA